MSDVLGPQCCFKDKLAIPNTSKCQEVSMKWFTLRIYVTAKANWTKTQKNAQFSLKIVS